MWLGGVAPSRVAGLAVSARRRAYRAKLEERRLRRLARVEAGPAAHPSGRGPGAPGSSRDPLVVTLEVQPDDTVRRGPGQLRGSCPCDSSGWALGWAAGGNWGPRGGKGAAGQVH
jgi:hypothetical protein